MCVNPSPWQTRVMVADRGWEALGLKPSTLGWLSDDAPFLDRVTLEGPLGFGTSLAFCLGRDVREPKVWWWWAAAALGLGFGAIWRDLPTFGVGAMFAGLYARAVYSLASMFGNRRLQTGIVRALVPHPIPGTVFALLEGDPTRVAMKENVAQTALMRLGRFEVLFFEEKNPKVWACELGFRPLQVSAAPTDAPRS